MEAALPHSQLEAVSASITTSQPPVHVGKTIGSGALTAFVSGHMDVTPQERSQHYLPRLDDALAQGQLFVIGDAKGVDASALAYLLSQSETNILTSSNASECIFHGPVGWANIKL